MSEYTPTLAEVRRIFSAHALKSDRVRLSAEFDRFIAKVKADALREAQKAIANEDTVEWCRTAKLSSISLSEAMSIIDDLIEDAEREA